MTTTHSDIGADHAGFPIHPSDILLELIVAFLAPMFMGASCGDLGFARLAAMETMASYGARTQYELMAIAQIIGFGLAAMDNLYLSMADEMPLTMKLRLRGCANALNRSAQQNQRLLDQGRRVVRLPDPAPPAPVQCDDDPDLTDEDISAAIARVRAVVGVSPGRVPAEPAHVTVASVVAADPAPSAMAAAGRVNVPGYVAADLATGSVVLPQQDAGEASAGKILEPVG